MTPAKNLIIDLIASAFLILGHHHHLPVCGWRSAALHALPAAGGPSDSQTRPVHAAAAQRGGLRGDSLNLSLASAQAGESLNLITSLALLACASKGDASAGGQQPGPGEHGAGAGGGSTAALEEAGPGAAQDGVRPAQVAELRLPASLRFSTVTSRTVTNLAVTPRAAARSVNVVLHCKYGTARVKG